MPAPIVPAPTTATVRSLRSAPTRRSPPIATASSSRYCDEARAAATDATHPSAGGPVVRGTLIVEADGGVATITLNRPDKLNSFNEAMHRELRDALDRIAGDPAVRAVLLTGAGKGFCAGQDLGDRAMTA